MITYSKDELLRFLDDVDAQLSEPADLVLIGGAADEARTERALKSRRT